MIDRGAQFGMVARLTTTFAVVTVCLSAPISAHEIGKTKIAVTVSRDSSYLLEVDVDPDALLLQLQLARDGKVPQIPSAAERDRQLSSMGDDYRHGVTLNADGVPQSPSFEYRPPSDTATAPAGLGSVRLTGRFPSGTHAMTIRYDWAGGTFALTGHIQDTAARTFWIEPRTLSQPIPLADIRPAPRLWNVALQYVVLGVTHIVPQGVDHILFVVGLCLLRLRWRAIVSQISAFTLAHSVTLALTVYGAVSLPSRVIEPLIALSIAYVAIENLMTQDLRPARTALVFCFGLLHGMGFASVLRDVGLPRAELLPALLSFNVGVELGQLTVVATVVLLVGSWALDPARYRRIVVQPSSIAIAAIGLYWTVQRLL